MTTRPREDEPLVRPADCHRRCADCRVSNPPGIGDRPIVLLCHCECHVKQARR